jgi:indolepyruvate ferredoxin oxidoreductase alpha subunit
MVAYAENAPVNSLSLSPLEGRLGVITCGHARNYYEENLRDLGEPHSHLHVGAYPLPAEKIRRLASHVSRLLVLEDGQAFVERQVRGLLGTPVTVAGRLSGEVPPTGELDPDLVRAALGIEARPRLSVNGFKLPDRPPQLCSGCPHAHAYRALLGAIGGAVGSAATGDIGCYTLGALAPLSAIESCVCMGASIGMAKGAAEGGLRPVIAVIGDSTFLHSGITPLMDAVAADTDMTVLILDNQAVAMTGGQEPVVSSSRLHEIVVGLGVAPEHLHVIDAHPKRVKHNTDVLRRELEHHGLSVVIAVNECVQTAKRKSREAALGSASPQAVPAVPGQAPMPAPVTS